MKNTFIHSFTMLVLVCGLSTTKAWVYPEHRDILLLAIQKLSPEYRSTLDALWAEARKGYELRLTEAVIDATQSINPTQIDYAAWPGIGGDHSVSAKDMLYNILQTDWILDVADITARLKIEIAESKNREERVNALRNSDIRLQRVDPEYATRAGHNNVHFLLSLQTVKETAREFGLECVKEGAELNALGVYIWYHYSALVKAARLNTEQLSSDQRAALILSALADEAFAIHFLEDVFAAGHAAGTWGDASHRKGTHDYYNEYGYRTSTWDGENIILTGDAWMRPEDAERSAEVVKLSLEQLLDAANGKQSAMLFSDEAKIFTPDDFNVSLFDNMPARKFDPNIVNLITPVFVRTPIPGLAHGLGELPRFRAELGPFIGFTPSLRGALISSGFGETQTTAGVIGGLETSIRIGLGMDGILNESSDGLVFLDLGWRQDGSSSLGVVQGEGIEAYGNLLAAIPGRSAYTARLRLPFYIIPGDLLLVAPILIFTSPETLTQMAVIAGNGGLIPWQSGIATSFGRFQFVLGREMGVYFFGRTKSRDALFNVSMDEQGLEQVSILSYRSTQFEFPILEYRPFRSFSTDQSSGLLIQFYGGIDVPHDVQVLTPASNTTPELKTIWYIGTRVVFNWRYYL
jgi:hypothetical protein